MAGTGKGALTIGGVTAGRGGRCLHTGPSEAAAAAPAAMPPPSIPCQAQRPAHGRGPPLARPPATSTTALTAETVIAIVIVTATARGKKHVARRTSRGTHTHATTTTAPAAPDASRPPPPFASTAHMRVPQATLLLPTPSTTTAPPRRMTRMRLHASTRTCPAPLTPVPCTTPTTGPPAPTAFLSPCNTPPTTPVTPLPATTTLPPTAGQTPRTDPGPQRHRRTGTVSPRGGVTRIARGTVTRRGERTRGSRRPAPGAPTEKACRHPPPQDTCHYYPPKVTRRAVALARHMQTQVLRAMETAVLCSSLHRLLLPG